MGISDQEVIGKLAKSSSGLFDDKKLKHETSMKMGREVFRAANDLRGLRMPIQPIKNAWGHVRDSDSVARDNAAVASGQVEPDAPGQQGLDKANAIDYETLRSRMDPADRSAYLRDVNAGARAQAGLDLSWPEWKSNPGYDRGYAGGREMKSTDGLKGDAIGPERQAYLDRVGGLWREADASFRTTGAAAPGQQADSCPQVEGGSPAGPASDDAGPAAQDLPAEQGNVTPEATESADPLPEAPNANGPQARSPGTVATPVAAPFDSAAVEPSGESGPDAEGTDAPPAPAGLDEQPPALGEGAEAAPLGGEPGVTPGLPAADTSAPPLEPSTGATTVPAGELEAPDADNPAPSAGADGAAPADHGPEAPKADYAPPEVPAEPSEPAPTPEPVPAWAQGPLQADPGAEGLGAA